MPRRTREHPLRRARKILGLSQAKLARLVGCKPISIRMIENGRLKMSHKLENRVVFETGFDFFLSEERNELVNAFGEPLTADVRERMKEKTRAVDEAFVRRLADNFAFNIEVLLIASLATDSNRFWNVKREIGFELHKIGELFELGEGVLKILNKLEVDWKKELWFASHRAGKEATNRAILSKWYQDRQDRTSAIKKAKAPKSPARQIP